MPELPEVQTVVNALQRVLPGETITKLELHAPRVYRHTTKKALTAGVNGATIDKVDRRGKFILLRFKGDRAPLAIHLRMSGKLIFGEAAEKSHPKHIRATIHFKERMPLHFVDVRQFGTFFLLDGSEPEGYHKLGVEPLSRQFTVKRLTELLEGRRTDLKAFLLKQETVAGVGNIYACEALWEAKLNPKLQAGELKPKQVERLHDAIKSVLKYAIEQMGTTFSDFKRPDGEPGEYGNELHVYQREGEDCHRCGTTIKRIAQHGRSTFFCPKCQHTRRGG